MMGSMNGFWSGCRAALRARAKPSMDQRTAHAVHPYIRYVKYLCTYIGRYVRTARIRGAKYLLG